MVATFSAAKVSTRRRPSVRQAVALAEHTFTGHASPLALCSTRAAAFAAAATTRHLGTRAACLYRRRDVDTSAVTAAQAADRRQPIVPVTALPVGRPRSAVRNTRNTDTFVKLASSCLCFGDGTAGFL